MTLTQRTHSVPMSNSPLMPTFHSGFGGFRQSGPRSPTSQMWRGVVTRWRRGRRSCLAASPLRRAGREVDRAESGQAAQLPVPRHPCGLLCVVSPPQRLSISDGRHAAAAVRVGVIRLKIRRTAAPRQPRVLLASVARSAKFRRALRAGEPRLRVLRVPAVDHRSEQLNDPHHDDQGEKADAPGPRRQSIQPVRQHCREQA